MLGLINSEGNKCLMIGIVNCRDNIRGLGLRPPPFGAATPKVRGPSHGPSQAGHGTLSPGNPDFWEFWGSPYQK